MNITSSLWVLVHSMSKSEKRYFKLQAQLQAGEKAYHSLFEMIDGADSAERAEERFREEFPKLNFEVAAKYLRQVVLNSLAHLRKSQNIQTQLFHSITQAEILFERGLVDEALSELRRGRKLAERYEHDALLLLIRRTELQYMSAREFAGVRERQLVDKQMKLNEVMRRIRSSNQHIQLYDVMKFRLAYRGFSRSDRQKEHLNDLVLSELHLIANRSSGGFETEKLHLLFQATYFLNTGNYTAALRFYQELIELFDRNEHRMTHPPIHYFNALKGVLDSLHSARLYDEMPYFIRKMEALVRRDYPQEFCLKVLADTYLSQFAVGLGTGEIDRVRQLKEEYSEELLKKLPLLDLQLQLRIHLSLVVLAIGEGDQREARRTMRKIIGAGKALYHFPDYKVARLLNLILQAESGDHDYLDHEVNSLKRIIAQEKSLYPYKTEKLLFRFLKQYPLPVDARALEQIWARFQDSVEELHADKYERPLLKVFDFAAWMESRLTSRSLPEVLKQRWILSSFVESPVDFPET